MKFEFSFHLGFFFHLCPSRIGPDVLFVIFTSPASHAKCSKCYIAALSSFHSLVSGTGTALYLVLRCTSVTKMEMLSLNLSMASIPSSCYLDKPNGFLFEIVIMSIGISLISDRIIWPSSVSLLSQAKPS